MAEIKINLERLTIKDVVMIMTEGGKITFGEQMQLMDKLVTGGVMELPLIQLPEVIALFNSELEKLVKYMKPNQGMVQALEIAKEKWSEDNE